LRIDLDKHCILLAAIGLISATLVLACGDDPDTGAIPATTPTSDAAPGGDRAMPTRDAVGDYRGLTIEQARELASFDVVLPDEIPYGLESPTIMLFRRRH
jgi:hypothetical protein